MSAAGMAFIDGRFCPIGEAKISVLDWGLLRSDATYDVVHVWKGRFFRLDDHLARFRRSVASLRMTLPLAEDRLRATLAELVARSGLRDAYVEMACTRGEPAPGSRDPRLCRNRFFAFAVPFVWIVPPERQEAGVDAVIARSVHRIPPASVDPTVKNYHWLDFTRGLFEAYDRGAETAILTDGTGAIAEGPGFNVFAVRGGAVTTPESGVLEGITRRTVLELCDAIGTPVALTRVSVEELLTADELFLSSTAGGIMPVRSLDGRPVGDGRPGAITRTLRRLYWEKKEAGWHGTAVPYDAFSACGADQSDL